MRRVLKATQRRLGIVGLGLMGTALAERALAAGYDVIGFDLAPERLAALSKLGGTPVASHQEVAACCQTIVVAVLTSEQSANVVSAMGRTLKPCSLIVDTTTGSPDEMVALGRRLARRKIDYVDACIAGNSDETRAGAVMVLAGGTKSAMGRCQPFLDCFAKQVFHFGPCGSGARMKLVVNLVLGLHRAVLAEALQFARAIGVAPESALNVLRRGAAYSRVMDVKGAKMLDRDFRAQARLDQHLKDIRIILQLAECNAAKVPLSKLHAEIMQQLVNSGLGPLDNSAIIEAFQ